MGRPALVRFRLSWVGERGIGLRGAEKIARRLNPPQGDRGGLGGFGALAVRVGALFVGRGALPVRCTSLRSGLSQHSFRSGLELIRIFTVRFLRVEV